MRFAGKTAIVTGAAGGIGGAIARSLAQEGAKLALIDRQPLDAKVVGGEAIALQIDVTQRADVEGMVRATKEKFGGIDILVTAAGVVSFGAAATLTEAEWDRVIAINLKGVFLCCQAVIPALRERRGGRIVNIGSIIGKNGGNARPWLDPGEQDRSSNVAYGASKAGVHALTLFLARELASDGITVNAVAPSTMDTPGNRAAMPDSDRKGWVPVEGVAAAIAWLAAEESAHVTGTVVSV